jgi:hypothetical protein
MRSISRTSCLRTQKLSDFERVPDFHSQRPGKNTNRHRERRTHQWRDDKGMVPTGGGEMGSGPPICSFRLGGMFVG